MRNWYFVKDSLKELETNYNSSSITNSRHKNVKIGEKGVVISKVKLNPSNNKENSYFAYSVIVMNPQSDGDFTHEVESTSEVIDISNWVKETNSKFSSVGVVGNENRETLHSFLINN